MKAVFILGLNSLAMAKFVNGNNNSPRTSQKSISFKLSLYSPSIVVHTLVKFLPFECRILEVASSK